jgi:conjugative transfer pilus assembly protein TraH
MIKKSILIILALSVGLELALPASGDITSDMSGMFQTYGFSTAGTSPGAYMAQTRGMITGGSFSARAPRLPLNLVSISPPSIKAGCGGLDMYFGGINFISRAEFTQLLKNIGQNAMGYAFELGLETLCPTCNATIKSLADKINKLMDMATNTCDAAKKIVNWGVQSTIEGPINDCISWAEDNGATETDARQDCINDGGQLAAGLYALTSSNNTNHELSAWHSPGVSTYDQLNYVTDQYGAFLPEMEKYYIMSLVGTYTTKITGTDGSTVATPISEWTGYTLSLKDFINGTDNATLIEPTYSGANTGVYDAVKYVDAGHLDGFKQYVYEELMGPQPDGTAGIGIINKLLNSQALTAQDTAFINSSPIPIKSLVDTTSTTPGLLNSAVDLTSDLIAIDMAVALVNSYVHAVASTAGKQSSVDKDKVLARIDKVKTDLHAELKTEFDYFNTTFRTYELTAFWYKEVASKARGNIAQHVGAAK